MNIVCAASVLGGEAAFSTIGSVTILPEEDIRRDHLLEADILITRSKARIQESLLLDTPVRFVGCAVAGTDHIDTDYLEQADIAWCHAPGCNADSVAEYAISAMLIEAERHHLNLDQCTVGIIGVGHIGSRVARLAEAIGLTVLLNDPPREAREGSRSMDFVALEDLLPAADFITLHVPYSTVRPHATHRLLDVRFFEQCTPGAILLNMARGEIMDSEAVLLALEHGILRQAVLDVWENEPMIHLDLMNRVDIATPHIAGYSRQGRLNGTRMVYEECCHYLEIEPEWDADTFPAGNTPPELVVSATDRTDQDVLTELVKQACPILADDQRFRSGAADQPEAMARHFVSSRRQYPERNEFSSYRVNLLGGSPALVDRIAACGFVVCG